MTSIGFTMLWSLAVIFLMMVCAIWYMNFVMHRWIGSRHQVLEYIVTTRRVPDVWSRKYEDRCKRLLRARAPREELQRLKQRAFADYERKLRRLQKYVETTNLVSDEATRRLLLEDLRQIAEDWRRLTR